MALPMQPFGAAIKRPPVLIGGKTPGAVFTQSPASPQIYTNKPAAPAPVAAPAPKPVVSPPEFKPTPVAQPAPAPAPAPAAPRPQPTAPAAQQQGGYGSFVQPPKTFGPGNNLINQQIAPAPTGPNSFDNEAAQYARGAQVGDYSGQTNEARQMILDQLKSLQNAPDRLQLAQQQYEQYAKNQEPVFQQQLRGVGQKAAALGRVGAGMTTNDLTGALGQHQNLLSNERQNLTNNALQNTLQDRLNIQGALQGAGGLLGGQDLSLNTAKSNAALGQASAFGGLGQNQAQRESNAVQQQMQQQQYQSGLDQQNIMNQIAQQQLQQQGQAQSWQQQFAQQQLAAQIAAQQNTQYPTSGFSGAGINSGQLGFQGY